MKKLFTIAALLLFAQLFTSCEEENITPDKLNTTKHDSTTQNTADAGQWD